MSRWSTLGNQPKPPNSFQAREFEGNRIFASIMKNDIDIMRVSVSSELLRIPSTNIEH